MRGLCSLFSLEDLRAENYLPASPLQSGLGGRIRLLGALKGVLQLGLGLTTLKFPAAVGRAVPVTGVLSLLPVLDGPGLLLAEVLVLSGELVELPLEILDFLAQLLVLDLEHGLASCRAATFPCDAAVASSGERHRRRRWRNARRGAACVARAGRRITWRGSGQGRVGRRLLGHGRSRADHEEDKRDVLFIHVRNQKVTEPRRCSNSGSRSPRRRTTRRPLARRHRRIGAPQQDVSQDEIFRPRRAIGTDERWTMGSDFVVSPQTGRAPVARRWGRWRRLPTDSCGDAVDDIGQCWAGRGLVDSPVGG